MGYPIYVYAWVKHDLGYQDKEVYAGKSWIKAIRAAIKAKRQGAGCIRVEWR